MDYMNLLRRAFNITIDYRALWIYGIILALTAPGGGGNGGGGGGGGGGSSSLSAPAITGAPGRLLLQTDPAGIGLVIAALVTLAIALGVIFTIARVVAETAAIRMVDHYEETGEQLSVRQGFRLGWSRAAWRIFLIDLLLGLGAFLVILLVIALTMAPLLALTAGNDALTALGIAATVTLGLLALLLIIIIIVLLVVLTNFFHRAAAMENLGVMDSIRRGWTLVRAHATQVVAMALILFALGLALALIVLPLGLLLLFASGAALGGLPALLAALISSLFLSGETPWIIAALVGVPIFLLVVFLPLLFAGGLVKVFTSSTWTLVYREMA